MIELPEETIAYITHNGVTVDYASCAFCELFKCEPQDVIDRAVESIIASDDLRALARLRGQHIIHAHDDREYRQQYDFLRFDGTRFWGEAISKRLPDERYLTRVEWHYNIGEPFGGK